MNEQSLPTLYSVPSVTEHTDGPTPPTLGGEKLRGDFQLLQRLESNVLQRNDQLLRFSIVKLDRHVG